MYFCKFCGKQLLINEEFVSDSDIIECSNCKNKFNFIKNKLTKKSVKITIDIKNILLSYFFRIIIFIPFIILFYLKKPHKYFLAFVTINFIGFIIALLIKLIGDSKLLNYFTLFDDNYLGEFDFKIILSDLIISLILIIIYLIFI